MNNNRKITDQEIEVFNFLNDLRETGVTNMFGAASYIMDEFSINNFNAVNLLKAWMANFRPDGNYDNMDINS